jgi:hypothetical protein
MEIKACRTLDKDLLMSKPEPAKERSILDFCADIVRKVSSLKIACDFAIKATELLIRDNYVRINVSRRLTAREIKSFRKEEIYREIDKLSDLVKLFNILYIGIAYGGIEKKFAQNVLKFIEDNGPNHRYDMVTIEATKNNNEIKFLT